MNKVKYRNLLSEIYRLVDKEKVGEALDLKKSSARIGVVQDTVRDAINKSSLCVFNGQPYYFAGEIYESMGDNDLGNLIYDLIKKLQLPTEDMVRIEGVIKICRRAVHAKTLRLNNAIMVFANGVFDMDKRQLYAFNRKYVQITKVDYNYDPQEHIWLWKMFIDEVIPSEVIRKVFQEFLGSIFIERSQAKMETMMVLRGHGSNGKSVVFETIKGILGRENVSNFGIGALITGSERKKNIAFINGKRLNYCSEIQTLEIGKSSDALKSLISGEPTEARAIYGSNFTAYDIPLLMANANQMPCLRDWSWGMRRRICIIPFDVEIPKERQNKNLSRELEKEYSAIFNWILIGRDRFISNGYKLTDSKILEVVMDEYQSESSSVMSFMYKMKYLRAYDFVVDAEPKWMGAHVLYRKYEKWCRQNNVEIENITKFGRILAEAGYRKKRLKEGVSYGIFGEAINMKIRYEQEKREKVANFEVMGSVKNGTMKPKGCCVTEDEIQSTGYKKYAIGYVGLGDYFKVNESSVRRWMKSGILEGCYTKFGNGTNYVFDLESSEDALIRNRKIKREN